MQSSFEPLILSYTPRWEDLGVCSHRPRRTTHRDVRTQDKWFAFPETKGHSLEEIAKVFDGPSAATSGAVFDKGDEMVGKGDHIEHVA